MSRWFLALLLALSFVTLSAPSAANAEDEKKPEPQAATEEKKPAEEKKPVAESDALDADSREAFVKTVQGELQKIVGKIDENPDEAQKLLEALRKRAEGAKAETEAGKELIAEVKGVLENIEGRLAISRLSLDELAKAVTADPKDGKALGRYSMKLQIEVSSLMYEDAEKAASLVKAAKEMLAGVSERSESPDVKKSIERQLKSLAGLERSVEQAVARAKLVGTAAVPFKADAWVNGSPLTDSDLKGKVVLLDFWAVWCGPCIATFPHLREWQEKYGDKGLVIIGVTNYYQFDWDEAKQRASRVEETTEEQERKMLEKFAAHYNLKHRFAVSEDRDLSKAYAVSGIPQVVLIDRQGKVNMVRVGSGPANARALDAAIEKLIAEKPAATAGE